jgi:NUMOD4 motif/HNH endonuclease
MNEIWRPIPTYEGEYEVSNLGRVRNVWRGQELSQSLVNGYARVSLRQKGFYVHRLVLLAFCGLPGAEEQCRHLDGNQSNNRLDNLLWGTAQENNADQLAHGTRRRGAKHHGALLSEEQVLAIRNSGSPSRKLAAHYGVSRSAVQDIRKRRSWSWLN